MNTKELSKNKLVTIFCKNNNTYKSYPLGTSLFEICEDMNICLKSQVVAARVNHKVESLNFLIFKPKNIEFIDATVSAGMRVYERSISMVMAKAVNDLFPRAVLRIEHPISKGVFCKISSFRNISEEQVQQLKARMHEIVDADLPIHEEEKQTSEVTQIFRKLHKMDKVRLFETLEMPYTRYFRIEDYYDYYSGILVPSTGYLQVFDLQKYQDGILLRIPNKLDPNRLEDVVPQPKLFEVFKEYIKWNKIIGLSSVGDFNQFAQTNKIQGIIKLSEALHERKIVQIVEMILRRKTTKFILISGPSSSGKTTFTKRLALQLSVVGLKPIMLSLDNYFVNRKDTPLDENGDWDFEHINALDLPLFNQQLKQLLAGEEVEIPFYNFELGIRQYRGEKLKLNKNNVLLIEGIHALNPDLLAAIPEESKFKIYVSALTTISLDNHNRLATTDTRLLRRIIRDYKFRNYSAQETIARWRSVRAGEDRWVFPYQEYADVMFNSALLFELAVLRKHAEPVLSEVSPLSDEYAEASRLLRFLKYFAPIHENEIPPTSLLREFLGGSSFTY